ncbi:uncharacterized protein [Clytia hemisphaerica]|uniref:Cnidarian restricted protein n=1 Tax=Clytia hemisphaerica TaxID=252671 RepID=A0A7M5V4A1_9CNID
MSSGSTNLLCLVVICIQGACTSPLRSCQDSNGTIKKMESTANENLKHITICWDNSLQTKFVRFAENQHACYEGRKNNDREEFIFCDAEEILESGELKNITIVKMGDQTSIIKYNAPLGDKSENPKPSHKEFTKNRKRDCVIGSKCETSTAAMFSKDHNQSWF